MKKQIKSLLLIVSVLSITMVIFSSSLKADELSTDVDTNLYYCGCPADMWIYARYTFIVASLPNPDIDSVEIVDVNIVPKGEQCLAVNSSDKDNRECWGTCKYKVTATYKGWKKHDNGTYGGERIYTFPFWGWNAEGEYQEHPIDSFPCADYRNISPFVSNPWGTNGKFRLKGGEDEFLASDVTVKVFPNPINASQSLTVDIVSPINDVAQLHIYDVNGKEYISYGIATTVNKGSNKVSFDVTDLKPGMYAFVVHLNGQNVIKKQVLIIQ